MAKTQNLYARIEPQLNEQAEFILTALGISASIAITIFHKQIVLWRGIPFEMKLPASQPVDMISLTKEQLNSDSELQKGSDDVAAGRTKLAVQIYIGDQFEF